MFLEFVKLFFLFAREREDEYFLMAAQGRKLEGGWKGRKGRRKRMVAASEVKEEMGGEGRRERAA